MLPATRRRGLIGCKPCGQPERLLKCLLCWHLAKLFLSTRHNRQQVPSTCGHTAGLQDRDASHTCFVPRSQAAAAAEDARAALLRVEAALAAREAAAAEAFEALRRQARQLHDSGCIQEAQVTPTLVVFWNICLLLLAPMKGPDKAHMPVYVRARCYMPWST